jgi:hypothetical protein
MPDFVFRPTPQRTGPGVREPGDSLLIVGDHAAVLQNKTRDEPGHDRAKEARWLAKHIAKAVDQATGTVRHLTMQPAQLFNVRDRPITVDARRYTWISIVVIDHPDPPEDFVPVLGTATPPVVVLLRRDWEFLFDHLHSTRAVLAYLTRVAGEPLALGREPMRYHEYALADIDTAPTPVDARLTHFLGISASTAHAPLHPAGYDDMPAHLLLRVIMEDIADSPLPPGTPQDDLLWVLSELDGMPVEARTELGNTLIGFMASLADWTGEGTRVHSRTVTPNPGAFSPLLFMAASRLSDEAKHALLFKTQLLHHDYHAAADTPEGSTVGIMLTPSQHPRRRWDTTMQAAKGNQGHSPSDIERLRELVAEAAWTEQDEQD